MKEMFEIVHENGDARTGLIYASVQSAKTAARKMGWVNYSIHNGYSRLYQHHAEDAIPAAALGHKGGKSTSPAKQAAVRENGKKGGRPRTKPDDK